MYIDLLKYGYKVWSPLFYPSNVLSNSEVSFIVISLGNSVLGIFLQLTFLRCWF